MKPGDPPLSLSTRPTHVRWWIFALACAASWLLYLHRYAWGVVKPYFKAENSGLSSRAQGLLDSVFLAAYTIGQVPAGLVGDLLGPRLVLTWLILLWSLLVAGLAWTYGYWPTYLVLFLFGLAQAGAYPVLSKVTRSWFPLSVRTEAFQGGITSMGRVGGACASAVLLVLLMSKLGLGWRPALVVLAVPGFALAAAVWLVFRNSPREHPWVNPAEVELIGGKEAPRAGVPSPLPRLRLDRATRFNLGMLLLYAFVSTFADMLYVYWVPSFLQEGKKLSAVEVGWLTMLPLLGGAVGGVVAGVLNDLLLRRTGQRRWARSSVTFTGKFLAACLLLLSLQVEDGRRVMVVLMVCKFFADWSLPTQWGTITDIAGRRAATVFGLVNTIGAVGGFVANPVLGELKDRYDWQGLFYGVAAAYLASALTWLFIDCTRRLTVEEPAAA